MEINNIAKKITENILLLATTRDQLKERATKKAEAMAEYEKELSKTIIQLKNGVRFKIDDIETPEKLPVTIIEKVAKGICYQEKLNAELAEAEYKNCIVAMRSIEVSINAYQSINRYLDEH